MFQPIHLEMENLEVDTQGVNVCDYAHVLTKEEKTLQHFHDLVQVGSPFPETLFVVLQKVTLRMVN